MPLTTPGLGSPCMSCPFRKANHFKRIPKGIYGEANARRLWGGLSRGERLACFELNEEGILECGGSLILVARHLQTLDEHSYETYLSLTPSPLTQEGERLWRSRWLVRSAPSIQIPTLEELGADCALPWSCSISNTVSD